jgi:ATP/maltotriose-dependent transcriptional regulator MalT
MAVLALLASGLRNKEIAHRLSHSARTVDHHLFDLRQARRDHACRCSERGVSPRGGG